MLGALQSQVPTPSGQKPDSDDGRDSGKWMQNDDEPHPPKVPTIQVKTIYRLRNMDQVRTHC